MNICAKKMKGYKLLLIKGEANEIESFTFLHLSKQEAWAIWKEAKANKETIYISTDRVVATIQCGRGSTTYKLFNMLAVQHRKAHPSTFNNVSIKYISNVEGTSALFRDNTHHIIKVISRKGGTPGANLNTINRICIDNNRRTVFFKDCKKSSCFKDRGMCAIDMRDSDMYNYWSDYMNRRYIADVAE